MDRRTFALTGLVALTAPGCLLHSVDQHPKPPIPLPDGYTDKGDDGDPGRWWTQFGDPDLDRLVTRALSHNMQIKAAWARVDQGDALRRMAMAGLFPRVDMSLSASRSKSPPRVFNLGGQEQVIPGVQASNFAASLPVSYELDVWGRVRSGMFAAEEDEKALRANVEAIAMTIAANVVERWFDVVEQRATRGLLEQQMETNKIFLELVKMRFREGDAALSDIYQQEQGLQALRIQLEGVTGREQVAEQQLALLVGTSPSKVVGSTRKDLPALPPLKKVGIPAKLLQRRPDLRAAERRVVAADYRIAEAIAQRFPQLQLSGSIGFNATDLAAFFESFVWSFMGSIAGNLFDGGAMYANIDRARAVRKEQLYNYGQALITALVEVESTLVQTRQQKAAFELQERQVEIAQRTLDAARRRFESGVGAFLPTLTALRSLQSAEQAKLTSQRQRLSLRVQLYRALGGRWTQELKHPDDDDDREEKRDKAQEKKPS